jgi:hypothetical protein
MMNLLGERRRITHGKRANQLVQESLTVLVRMLYKFNLLNKLNTEIKCVLLVNDTN